MGRPVEILNLSSDQVEAIRKARNNPEWNPRDIIGMRYTAVQRTTGKWEVQGWNHGGDIEETFDTSQLKFI